MGVVRACCGEKIDLGTAQNGGRVQCVVAHTVRGSGMPLQYLAQRRITSMQQHRCSSASCDVQGKGTRMFPCSIHSALVGEKDLPPLPRKKTRGKKEKGSVVHVEDRGWESLGTCFCFCAFLLPADMSQSTTFPLTAAVTISLLQPWQSDGPG